jgi:L-asparagine permease
MMGATVVGIPALVGGWYLVRGRVAAAAQDIGAPPAVVDLED